MTKLSSENLIKEFSYSNNIKYIINRFGVIAGPWQFGKRSRFY
jgi:CDP-paratose 2-epimerase